MCAPISNESVTTKEENTEHHVTKKFASLNMTGFVMSVRLTGTYGTSVCVLAVLILVLTGGPERNSVSLCFPSGCGTLPSIRVCLSVCFPWRCQWRARWAQSGMLNMGTGDDDKRLSVIRKPGRTVAVPGVRVLIKRLLQKVSALEKTPHSHFFFIMF